MPKEKKKTLQEKSNKDEPKCPMCGSKFIMTHRYDVTYKLCIECYHNWKE